MIADRHRPLGDLLLLAALWLHTLAIFVPEWLINEQYGYGMVVPLLCAYLLYLRWDERPPPQARPARGWRVGLVAGIVLHLPLTIILGGNPEWRAALWLQALLSVGLTLCIAGAWGGRPWARMCLSSLLLFLFAVPWPSAVEQPLVLGLMGLVAQGTVFVLNLFGIFAERHGNLIELSNSFVGVEEACSGVRSFQSTIMGAFFLGVLFRWTLPQRLLLLVGGGLVSLALNFGRTLILTLVTARRGVDAMDVVHDPVGHVISLAAFFVLFLLAWLIHRFLLPARARQAYWATGARAPAWQRPGWGIALTALLAAAHLGTAGWYARADDPRAVRVQAAVNWERSGPRVEFKDIPPAIRAQLRYSDGRQARWRDAAGIQWTAYFLRWDPGRVSAYVDIHRPEVCMPSAGFTLEGAGEPLYIEAEGLRIRFDAYHFRFGDQQHLVYFGVWDSVPGRVLPVGGGWRARLRAAWLGSRVGERYSLQLILSGVPPGGNNRARVGHWLETSLALRAG
jgi:exosortase